MRSMDRLGQVGIMSSHFKGQKIDSCAGSCIAEQYPRHRHPRFCARHPYVRHPCVGNSQGKSRGRIGDRLGLNFFDLAPLCTVRAGRGLVGESREFSAIFGSCRLPRPSCSSTPDFRRLCDQSERRMDGKCIQGTFFFVCWVICDLALALIRRERFRHISQYQSRVR